MSGRDQPRRTLYLNNTEVEYIPDTGAAMSVISEETAKRAGLKVNPYDSTKVRVITADGRVRYKKYQTYQGTSKQT